MNIIPRKATRKLVVHCSATRATSDIGRMDIDLWHRRQGWRMIGYHFVIRRDGTLEVGRHEDEPGAHVSGHNADSIGICMVGGLGANNKGENNFTPAQFATLRGLLVRLTDKYPEADVLGHRDLSPDKNKDGKVTKNEYLKECPSFDVRSWWAAAKPA